MKLTIEEKKNLVNQILMRHIDLINRNPEMWNGLSELLQKYVNNDIKLDGRISFERKKGRNLAVKILKNYYSRFT